MNYKVIFADLISEYYAMSNHALDSEDGDLCYLRNQLKDYLDLLLDDPESVDIFFFLIADIMQYQILHACNGGES
jgi:hypothetical protein